jgi:ATP-binding cassette, subfamily G (WHITE), member 2, SNQ2
MSLTAGLDSQSAYNIIRFLRKLARAGQAILCTIHQPNDSLFEQFDRLLLLQRGGRTVYFGEIGDDACILREYFRRHGAECPPRYNPAEFMLEAIGAGSRPRVGDRDWADIWTESEELEEVKKEIIHLKEERRNAAIDTTSVRSEYATPLLYQIKVALRRMNLTYWRSPNYGILVSVSANLRLHEDVYACGHCIFHWYYILATRQYSIRSSEPNLCDF